MEAFREELVYTESEDDFLLHGAVTRPARGPAKPLALIWIHGYSVSSFLPTVTKLGRILAQHSYVFVSANTRGHDLGAVLWRHWRNGEPVLGGGWWERFDECPLDLGAWVTFSLRLGLEHVVLIGHSFGACKVVHYQVERQDPRIAGLVLASPFIARAYSNPDLLELADTMVTEGRGEHLLPWGSFRNWTLSAQAYSNRRERVDVFGHHTPEPAIRRVSVPIFAFYGTDEAAIGTAADLQMIQRNARPGTRVDTRMFAGATHNYLDHEAKVAQAIASWADQLS